MRVVSLTAVALILCLPAISQAAEADYLRSIAGSWSGKGLVLTKIGGSKVNVSCSLQVGSTPASLSMKGRCRGLLVSRGFSADVKTSGSRYSGTYVGPAGQSSSLSGSRHGDTVNLAVTWARVVNGDRSAGMTIEKLGTNGLRLRTIDKDVATGRSVATSSIEFTRR
ncbi:hypothetical protein GAO09_21735 [Rhizobiales bacterium RZME27]|uniref:Uncharacterized protein n=1 Tax=Endobacterium cereale TaxID=2663029 RepID=A0A6A8AIP0_9HYPH|nr:hypothetical protein [Endobacterium cereale]MEB2844249.1 hypothetical protein [Endobacterium cereale]MQY48661.1 hypothetical protein [Endobacterium cereale]